MSPRRSRFVLSGVCLLAAQVGCGGAPGSAVTTTTDSSSGAAANVETGGSGSGGASGGAGAGGGGGGLGSGGFGAAFGTGGIWTGNGGTLDPGCAPEGVAGTAGSGGTEAVMTVLEQRVPYQAWPSMEATTTGILYVNQSASFGATIDHLRWIGDAGDLQHYVFATEGSSPFQVLFPSSGEGDAYAPDREVRLANREVVEIASALFGPQTANVWGLEQEAHIVELEVNDGGGHPSGLWPSFVATDVTILSGTTEIPMNPSQTMNAAAALFEAELEGVQTELETLLTEALEKTNPTCGVLTERDVVGLWPAWQTEEKILSLTFVHQHERIWKYDWLVSPGTSGTPPLHGQGSHGHIVEYVTRYDYDATGVLLDSVTDGPIATDYPLVTRTGL